MTSTQGLLYAIIDTDLWERVSPQQVTITTEHNSCCISSTMWSSDGAWLLCPAGAETCVFSKSHCVGGFWVDGYGPSYHLVERQVASLYLD